MLRLAVPSALLAEISRRALVAPPQYYVGYPRLSAALALPASGSPLLRPML